MLEIEARVKRLLDQLENPNLTDTEIARLKSKIEFLVNLLPPVVSTGVRKMSFELQSPVRIPTDGRQ